MLAPGYPLSRFANLFGPITSCASIVDGALKCCGVISQTPTGGARTNIGSAGTYEVTIPWLLPHIASAAPGWQSSLALAAAEDNRLRATPHQNRSQLRHRSFARHHQKEGARQSSRPRFLTLRTIGTDAPSGR